MPDAPRFDLPPDCFPVTIEALHVDTRAVVWRDVIGRPSDVSVVYIPPLARILGHKVAIRVTFATGRVQIYEPPEAGHQVTTNKE